MCVPSTLPLQMLICYNCNGVLLFYFGQRNVANPCLFFFSENLATPLWLIGVVNRNQMHNLHDSWVFATKRFKEKRKVIRLLIWTNRMA